MYNYQIYEQETIFNRKVDKFTSAVAIITLLAIVSTLSMYGYFVRKQTSRLLESASSIIAQDATQHATQVSTMSTDSYVDTTTVNWHHITNYVVRNTKCYKDEDLKEEIKNPQLDSNMVQLIEVKPGVKLYVMLGAFENLVFSAEYPEITEVENYYAPSIVNEEDGTSVLRFYPKEKRVLNNSNQKWVTSDWCSSYANSSNVVIKTNVVEFTHYGQTWYAALNETDEIVYMNEQPELKIFELETED